MRVLPLILCAIIAAPSFAVVNDPLFKEAPWFQGDFATALTLAQKEQKQIFLYWGAVWCPPCNELKNEVFNKDQFKSFMQASINVFLDGDSENAQKWGDVYKISGYPTLLLLSPSGKELTRINTSVDIATFQDIILKNRANKKPIKEIFELAASSEKAKLNQVTNDDWFVLSQLYWDGLDQEYPNKQEIFTKRLALMTNIPSSLKAEKALLTAGLIQSLMENEESQKFVTEHKKELQHFVKEIVSDEKSIYAARSFVAYYFVETLNLLYTQDSDRNEKMKLAKQWITAAQKLRSNKNCSVDVRLWAAFAPINFEKSQAKDKKISKNSLAAVKQAVQMADKEAVNAYERHAVISGAAYILREVGEFDLARQLLDKELKLTDTPWYYQSSYANLEVAAGNIQEAYKWSKAAKESVQGRASKIQWTVDNVLFITKYKIEDQANELAKAVDDYYGLAFDLQDGFLGRNATRAKRVSERLSDWVNSAQVNAVVKKYQKKCGRTKIPGCQEHFQAIGKSA